MKALKRKHYEKTLEDLYVELLDLQRWIIASGKRVVVIFEGRDAAGKGGVIKAISGPLNTRYTRIVALPKPSEREATQWYFQRYIEHLPAAGEIVLFDRSWYNRAGVEHVMGFCSEAQYRRFLVDCPAFEKLITGDGIVLVKYWLAVDQAQQEERSAQALEDFADRPQGARAVRRLRSRAGRDDARDAHAVCAMVRGGFQRPEARPSEPDAPSPRPPARTGAARSAAEASRPFRQARRGAAAVEKILDSGTFLIRRSAACMDARSGGSCRAELHLKSTRNVRSCVS